MIKITDEMVVAALKVAGPYLDAMTLREVLAAVAPLIAAQEREGCAKVADHEAEAWGGNYRATRSTYDHARSHVLREIADMIRARGGENDRDH